MAGEPATAGLLGPLAALGKTVALPRCLPGRRMEARAVPPGHVPPPGTYGIPEPGTDCPLLERDGIDLILTPALCYDARRYRLGKGGGYYDRYLRDYAGCSVGLCRNIVLQECLPLERTDIPVTIVLTESACLR